jgi:hypothetical protein
MGRKNKNILGGAASGAGAGLTAGGLPGALIGAGVGGLLGSQQDDSAQQLAPVIPQDVINKLYQQSIGNQPTIGELKGAQMYDKNLAQQIAAAKAQRGVNPGLLSRNVNRIAAEQSQANAQNAAILAAEERNQALAKYMQAQEMNAGIAAKNLGFEREANQRADNMLGAGLNSLGASLALDAQKKDAAGETAKAAKSLEMQDALDNSAKFNPSFGSSMQNTRTGSNDSYGINAELTPAQSLNQQYTMGADQEINPGYKDYSMMSKSDRNAKTKIKSEGSMKMMSDERQKDLVKNENLPPNNNMQVQNQNAIQPQAMESGPQVAQPAQATPQASAPQQAAAAPTKVPPPGITADMLQKAQQSSKGGGNVSNIQNSVNTLQRGRSGPSQEEILDMSMRAQRAQTRDVWGNVQRSDRENYAQYMGEWQAQQDALNAAYDKQQGTVNEENLAKDAQRTARLNRFYTGIDTGSTNAVASQFAPKEQLADSGWGAAQAYQRSQGIGDQSRGTMDFIKDTVKNNAGYIVPMYGQAQLASRLSDENQKTDIKNEGKSDSKDFNPKSFLDKLQAYSYEYKEGAKSNPKAGEGRFLSPMAQDLEKAGPVGKSMVEQDPQGNKVVDYAKGFGAILASQAHLNERLSSIEKMYSKKKKES